MNKNTLSHYGWIVVLILILSVLLALATPFGNFVARGFEATYVAFSLGDYDGLGNVIDNMGGNGEGQQVYSYSLWKDEVHNTSCYTWKGEPYGSEEIHTEGHNLTDIADLPVEFIAQRMINYYCETTENYMFEIPEQEFKEDIKKVFVNVSNEKIEELKAYSLNYFNDFRFDGEKFIMSGAGGSGDITYGDIISGYKDNGNGSFDIYRTINKKSEVENPYNLFDEDDFGSYDEYEAAVQKYMEENGIEYNGMEDIYYTESVDCFYIVSYECEGLTNFKVNEYSITSTDKVLETNLKIKSVQKVNSLDGISSLN